MLLMAPVTLLNLERGKTKAMNPSTEAVVRAFLSQPDVLRRLEIANYPHPYPEDCIDKAH